MPRKEPRNYKKEYKEYHGKPKQRKNRALRPREVDHRKPLSKGGGNGKKNLRAVSKKTNRKKGNR